MLRSRFLSAAVFVAAFPAFGAEYIVRAKGRANAYAAAFADTRLLKLSEDEAEDWRGRGFLVEKNKYLRLVSSGPASFVGLWGLEAVRAREANRNSRGAGEGVTVCVVDTGVDIGHPALDGAIVGGFNVSGEGAESDFQDRNGHGTHVAGIIAGRDVGNFRGVAPAARIYVAKAFGADGGTTTLAVAKAIRGCIGKARIMNLSFGAHEDSDVIGDAIDAAAEAGITMIAAGGNGGAIGFPARHPRVIAVSSMNKLYRMSENACRGAKVEFYAPGSEIFAPHLGGYRSLTGTSMAAAFVTGIEAIRQSRGRAKLLGRTLPALEKPLIDAVNTAVGGR